MLKINTSNKASIGEPTSHSKVKFDDSVMLQDNLQVHKKAF